MRTYRSELKLPPDVARDDTSLGAIEDAILEYTKEWPARNFSAEVQVGNSSTRGETIEEVLGLAGTTVAASEELRLFVQSAGTRSAHLWLRGKGGDPWFVAQVVTESPSEVEAEGIKGALGNLANVHAVRLAEEREARAEGSEMTPSSLRSVAWWRDNWVVTIVGGVIAAVIAAFIIAALIGN